MQKKIGFFELQRRIRTFGKKGQKEGLSLSETHEYIRLLSESIDRGGTLAIVFACIAGVAILAGFIFKIILSLAGT